MYVKVDNDLYTTQDCGSILEDGTYNGCFYLCLKSFLLRENIIPDVLAYSLRNLVSAEVDVRAEREQVGFLAQLLGINITIFVLNRNFSDDDQLFFCGPSARESFRYGSKKATLALYQGHYYLASLIEDSDNVPDVTPPVTKVPRKPLRCDAFYLPSGESFY